MNFSLRIEESVKESQYLRGISEALRKGKIIDDEFTFHIANYRREHFHTFVEVSDESSATNACPCGEVKE